MSKYQEALLKLHTMPSCSECEHYGKCFDKPYCKELYEQIKQDLERLEKLEKENQELKEDNLQMQGYYDYYSKENVELNKELKRCQEYIQKSVNDHKNLIIENGKMKKALDILKDKIINLETLNISADLDTYHEILKDNPFYDKLTQEEFKLLKEVLQDD